MNKISIPTTIYEDEENLSENLSIEDLNKEEVK